MFKNDNLTWLFRRRRTILKAWETFRCWICVWIMEAATARLLVSKCRWHLLTQQFYKTHFLQNKKVYFLVLCRISPIKRPFVWQLFISSRIFLVKNTGRKICFLQKYSPFTGQYKQVIYTGNKTFHYWITGIKDFQIGGQSFHWSDGRYRWIIKPFCDLSCKWRFRTIIT